MDKNLLPAAQNMGDQSKCNWVDITEEFMDACKELELGELVQETSFNLFEAMSAIEMMDPKMDIGLQYNKDAEPPHTFETAVQAGVLKIENLTPEELIGIFDSLFACLVSWLDGNSMDQVLSTCLYLHKPANIHDNALRAFCHAVRNIITIIRNIIIVANVSEEEDFQLNDNSELLTVQNIRSSFLTAQLKEAEDYLVRQSIKSNDNIMMTVVHRLRFMRHLFQTLYHFECACIAPKEKILTEIYKNLNICLELLPLLKRTIDKGTQPTSPNSPNPMGFSPYIHDRSQPPTFPRSVKLRDRLSSFIFLEEMLQRLKLSCKIVKMTDYYQALNFFIDFSRKSDQCILSRSIMQGIFHSDHHLIFGTIPIKDFLWDSVRAFTSPPVLNPKHTLANDRQIQTYLDLFFQYCISLNTFTLFIRTCGFNRARQRDKLANLIESFDSIQVEAARVDSHLSLLADHKAEEGNDFEATSLRHSTEFTTWVLYNCFRAMFMYLFSGFELELYSVHEYLYIYWYPYELLIGFIVNALQRTENSWIIQEEYAEQQSKQNGGGGNRKTRKPKQKKNKKQHKPYRQEIIYYHAVLNMCGGYYKAFGGLTKDGRIRQPMPKFNNEEVRFKRRFAAFAMLKSPPPVIYAEFRDIRDNMMKSPSSDIYEGAAKLFEQARNVLESMQNPEQEVLEMIQVAKINFVVMNVLSKGHQKDLKTQPEFDFSKHRYFPIIKI